MKPPIVKICGLRRLADAELSLELGAEYLGCVLAADSPRCATVEEVVRIAEAARDCANVVLVFRKANAGEILRICEATSIRRVQIHGVSPMACRTLNFNGIRVHSVFRVSPDAVRLPDLDPSPTPQCPAILDGGVGGSGQRFSWDLLSDEPLDSTFIAGGITPDNVSELLRHRPFGIDVSSGVEESHGVKDASKLRRLFEHVNEFASSAQINRKEVGS